MKIYTHNIIGVRFYATKKTVKAEQPLQTGQSDTKVNLLTKLRNSQLAITNKFKRFDTLSSIKLVRLSYNTFKLNMKRFIFSILSVFGLARLVNPVTLTLFTFIRVTLKWFLRGLTLFNVVLFIWIFYFNTPLITAKLILGWLGDFFRVSWATYKDAIVKFLDYIYKIMEHGFKSVPKHASKPIEYPNYGFIREYRELFRKIRELTPINSEYPNTRRWYDSLRDLYVDRPTTNPFFPRAPFNPGTPFNPSTGGDSSSYFNTLYNVYQFMKDYSYIGAIIGGAIVTGGTLFYFWDPISTGAVLAGATVKQAYLNCIQYFSTRPPVSDTGSITPIDVVDITNNPDLESLARRFPSVPNSVIGDSGASTPTGGGSITPTGGGSISGDITPRVNQSNISLPTLNIPSGSNPWGEPSPMAGSPVLDRLGPLNPDIFKAPEFQDVTNSLVSNDTTTESLVNNTTESLVNNTTESLVKKTTDSLVDSASGPKTFPADFDKA